VNTAEFNSWFAEYCAAFPGTKEFVVRGVDGGKQTLAFWFKVLEPHDVDVAKTATMLMLAGKEEQVDIKDRAKIPAHVATLCEKLVDRQRHAKAVESAPTQQEPDWSPEQPAQWDSVGIVRKLMACAEQGGDVEALGNRLMPIDPESEPRYRCLWCRDRGRLTAWHPHTMRLAARGKAVVGGRGLYQCCVTCSCRAGELYKKPDKPVFNERQWLPCRGLPYKQADLDELNEFMANYKPANYESSFDDGNW